MATATLTSKGQITLPQAVRRRLGLKAGDRVDFVFDRAGSVVLKSQRTPFEQLRGLVKIARRGPLGVRAMDRAIAASLAGRFRRVDRSF